MIQEALATQAEAHNKELAEQAARFRTSSAAHTTPVASSTVSSSFHPLVRRFQGLDSKVII